MKKRKKVFSFLDVSIIVIVCSFVMCFLGAAIIYKHLGGVNFSLLGEDENLKEFIGAYNNLIDNYYDKVNKKDIIDGAIDGMYKKTGDPYTTYLDDDSSTILEDSLNGNYTGFGIQILKAESGELIIDEVFKDTPASNAGIQKGDIIRKVEDLEVTSENRDEVVDKIKSSKKVNMTLESNGTIEEVSIESSNIMVPVTSSKVFNHNGHNIGYISLSVFNDTADIQFSNDLNDIEGQGIDSLVIDLRGNSGGYLQIAENITESFLEKGKLVYSLESKGNTEKFLDKTSEHRTYPIAVLINRGSASASEILASALKYSYGATLVGTNSYGKGKVQEKSELTDGTSVKVTTAMWLTPNGDCIDGKGLTPDVSVSLDTENATKGDINTDTQLLEALNNLAAR